MMVLLLATAACAMAAQGEGDPDTTGYMEGMQGMMDAHHNGRPMDGGEHDHTAGEHMSGPHAIPEEAAEIPNPIASSEASVAVGQNIYAANCTVCHGENGRGDGPTADALAISPADLHESHVQDLTDGALYYVITKGRSGTPMPAWEDVLDEDERWHVVNFLRTFRE
jgi:mono/diheme cytochrome c family protein